MSISKAEDSACVSITTFVWTCTVATGYRLLGAWAFHSCHFHLHKVLYLKRILEFPVHTYPNWIYVLILSLIFFGFCKLFDSPKLEHFCKCQLHLKDHNLIFILSSFHFTCLRSLVACIPRLIKWGIITKVSVVLFYHSRTPNIIEHGLSFLFAQ